MANSGRAVLIGTRSVEASELLASLFSKRGLCHTVLNARQDGEEAETVAQAGSPNRITVATNMAGRGTDIHLDLAVRDRGGLHVILTEFHESSRIDRQLFGRCARQGEPGSVEAIVSLEDDLFIRYTPSVRALAQVTSRSAQMLPQTIRFLVRYAQAIAERRNARIRYATLKEDRKLQSLLSFSGSPN